MKLCNFIVSRLLISYSLVYYKHIILHYYYLRLWVAWHDNCVEIIIQTCRWYSILNIGHIFWHRYSFRILYTKAICWEESSFTNYLLSTPYFYSLHYELTTANVTMLKYNSMSDLVIPISTFFRDRWWASRVRLAHGVGYLWELEDGGRSMHSSHLHTHAVHTHSGSSSIHTTRCCWSTRTKDTKLRMPPSPAPIFVHKRPPHQ